MLRRHLSRVRDADVVCGSFSPARPLLRCSESVLRAERTGYLPDAVAAVAAVAVAEDDRADRREAAADGSPVRERFDSVVPVAADAVVAEGARCPGAPAGSVVRRQRQRLRRLHHLAVCDVDRGRAHRPAVSLHRVAVHVGTSPE